MNIQKGSLVILGLGAFAVLVFGGFYFTHNAQDSTDRNSQPSDTPHNVAQDTPQEEIPTALYGTSSPVEESPDETIEAERPAGAESQRGTTPQTEPIEATSEPALAKTETVPAAPQEPAPAESAPISVAVPNVQSSFTLLSPTLTYDGMYNGPLYATSEQIGTGYSIEDYFANLNRNGVSYMIGMFAMSGPQDADALVAHEGLGYILNAVKKYPYRVIPFFNPGLGGEEVEPLVGDELTYRYSSALSSSKSIVGNMVLKGLGEIETQEWAMAHNDPRVLQLANLANANGINLMFHPVASKLDNAKTLIEAYPGINFLFHMYREDVANGKSKLIDLLKTHDNAYFSIDAAHIAFNDGNDILYTNSKASGFISEFDRNYDRMVSSAEKAYRDIVIAAPLQVVWGTEAGPEYSFEPAVYDRLIKISRDLIGRMPSEYQEALAYKNALRAFGEGAVLTTAVEISDTGTWDMCSDDTMDACDASCGIETDADAEEPAKDACFKQCLNTNQCIDPEL
jgi:hypothetical protein